MCSETIDLPSIVGAPCSARTVAFLPTRPRHSSGADVNEDDAGNAIIACVRDGNGDSVSDGGGGGGGGGVAIAVLTSIDRMAIMLAGREDAEGEPVPPVVFAACNLRVVLGNYCGVSADAPFFIRQICWTATRGDNASGDGDGSERFRSTFLCVAWVRGADELIEFDVTHGGGGGGAGGGDGGGAGGAGAGDGGGDAVVTSSSPATIVPVGRTTLKSPAVRLQPNECGTDADRLVAVLALSSGDVLRCVRPTPSRRAAPLSATRLHVELVPWITSSEWMASVAQTTSLAVLPVKASPSSLEGGDGAYDGMVDASDDEDDGDGGHGGGGDDEETGGGAVAGGGSAAIEHAIVTLSSAGQLCVNGRLISTNCNSFAVHDSFLLFATHDHTLRFLDTNIPLHDAIDALEAGARGVLAAAAERSVERGSRIVTAVPFGTRVILQVRPS